MRRHNDAHGQSWDVVLGRESFGALFAIFVPAAGNAGVIRQALLEADSQTGAGTELDRLSTDELNQLLTRSEPKDLG